MDLSPIQEKIIYYVNRGIFSNSDLAKALCMTLDNFKEVVDSELRIYIDKLIVDHKARLLDRIHVFSSSGVRAHEVQFEATKYLLSSLHGLTERSIFERKIISMKAEAEKVQQVTKAADCMMKLDPAASDKFMENISKVKRVIK